MTEFLKDLWMKLFGTTEWLGLDIGFWISMLAVIILVVVMVAVFWSMKAKTTEKTDESETALSSNGDTE